MISRLALHSSELKFKDINNKDFDQKAEMPKDMRALLQQLRKRQGV